MSEKIKETNFTKIGVPFLGATDKNKTAKR
jgi:hypothetical protein